ncbi:MULTISPECIES: hypothetical protein [unclassified Pseudomonas]|uniref:hypothetical protein n=1 Tax=unclassified Pseudomonas TaxID=196821 RepID=UPI003132CF33
MKKLVPDPPLRPINTPFFTPKSDIYPPLALAHVIELLRGVIETLDEQCRSHAGDAGLGNALHATEIAHSLVTHSHARLFGQKEEG